MTERFSLKGQVAVVTGASRGLGYEMARAIAECGAKVWITARGKDQLEAAAEKLRANGHDISVRAFDLADGEACVAAVNEIAEIEGRFDILVNNAGINAWEPLAEATTATWDRVMGTNLRAPYLLCREAARHMGDGGRPRPAQRQADDDCERKHSDDGAQSEHGHIGQTLPNGLHAAEREYHQRGRAGHAMHHANHQCAKWQWFFVKVLVWVSRMWTAGDMTVGVEVGFLTVAVHMIVHALAPQTQQYVDTENDQHQADRGFEQQCQMWTDRAAEQQNAATKHQQGECVPQAPGHTMACRIAQAVAAGAEAGNGGKVIGLDRMLQPQQQTENEYAEHRWLRSIKKGLLRLIAADTLPPVNRNSFWPAFGGCFAAYEWSVAARTA